MTYYESSEGLIISKNRAIKELIKHDIYDIDSFMDDMGDHANYIASDVLGWLGY